ncbi:hypothetical protein [Silicimonas sp. MF1-12-2]|uniref:hypothetical protein n=1 Tax=Silicimonas sp. MF1-12-2 TaxID=3384793 RepID=UPI0039B3E3DC
MSRGVFSADFARVFEDVLSVHFEDFPSRSGEIPDPQGVVEAQDTPDDVPPDLETPPTNASMPELPVDVFEFISESAVAHAAVSVPGGNATAAVRDALSSTDELTFAKPDGTPGGKPKPEEPPVETVPPTLAATYTSGSEDGSGFNIVIEFYDEWPRYLMDAFGAAADFLSSIILNDLENMLGVSYTYDASLTVDIDDLLIEAYLPAIDGAGNILGGAGFDDLSQRDDGTPSLGLMMFDVADAEQLYTDGNWDAVVLHEMLHVLGIGTLWDELRLLVVEEFGANTKRKNDDYSTAEYIGAAGNAEYKSEGGEGWIIVETDFGDGTAFGHWDEAAYSNELMTGLLYGDSLLVRDPDPYLADWTLMSLNDIGYTTVVLSQEVGENTLSGGIILDDVVLGDADLMVIDETLIIV